jgi:hypothetical protein
MTQPCHVCLYSNLKIHPVSSARVAPSAGFESAVPRGVAGGTKLLDPEGADLSFRWAFCGRKFLCLGVVTIRLTDLVWGFNIIDYFWAYKITWGRREVDAFCCVRCVSGPRMGCTPNSWKQEHRI